MFELNWVGLVGGSHSSKKITLQDILPLFAAEKTHKCKFQPKYALLQNKENILKAIHETFWTYTALLSLCASKKDKLEAID